MQLRLIAATITLLLSVLLPQGGDAWDRGGINTTWSPDLFGGGWVCFNSLVTGCSQAFNATCSPTGSPGDDAAALNSFNTYFAAQTSTVKLFIAPGSVCHTEGSTNQFGWGTQPLIIWAYNAKTSNGNFGGADFYQDAVHQAKIATVSAGASTVSLITPSEISRYSVGDNALVGGVSLQTFGYPPNFQFHDWETITAITTDCPSPCTSSTLTLSRPLANGYKSTWPDLGIGDSPTPLGGPGTIYDIMPQFSTNLTIYGLTVMQDVSSPNNGANVVNRNITFVDVNNEGAGWGFRGQNITMTRTFLPGGTEFDKDIENLTCNYCSSNGDGFNFASASPTNLTITNSTAPTLSGTGLNATVTNSTFSSVGAGIAGYGAATNVRLNGVTFSDAHTYYHTVPTTDLSFSPGTFTILKSAGTISNIYATFVPGFKYYLGGVAGNTVCSPAAVFTVTDLREDATHVFIDIDQSTLPACGGGATILSYGQYHALTATQTSSGPASIFSNPEMVPPP
jgi:hypothetical protein